MGGSIVVFIELAVEGEGGAETADMVAAQCVGISAQIVAFEHFLEVAAVCRHPHVSTYVGAADEERTAS